jgi:hypothetical protein
VTMEKFIDNYFHHVKGVFEGDDGLTTFSPDCQLKTEHYTDLGLLIKLEDHKELGTASFCGNLFDEIDLVQITDPLRVVATIGWCNRKYVRCNARTKNALLRCKALSYLHQYPGCPIIQSLSLWIIRCTFSDQKREHDMIDQMDQWHKMQTLQAYERPGVARNVPMRTRMLMEKLFKVSVEDQKAIERWFDAQTTIRPITIPELEKYWPEVWKYNAEVHVTKYMDPHPIVSLNETTKAKAYVDYMKKFVPTMNILHHLIERK